MSVVYKSEEIIFDKKGVKLETPCGTICGCQFERSLSEDIEGDKSVVIIKRINNSGARDRGGGGGRGYCGV